jgi:hypothetical protein
VRFSRRRLACLRDHLELLRPHVESRRRRLVRRRCRRHCSSERPLGALLALRRELVFRRPRGPNHHAAARTLDVRAVPVDKDSVAGVPVYEVPAHDVRLRADVVTRSVRALLLGAGHPEVVYPGSDADWGHDVFRLQPRCHDARVLVPEVPGQAPFLQLLAADRALALFGRPGDVFGLGAGQLALVSPRSDLGEAPCPRSSSAPSVQTDRCRLRGSVVAMLRMGDPPADCKSTVQT